MPLDHADARRLERLLKTLAPPATVTAPYRLQVVQAAFDARLKVLTRRQRRKMIGSSLAIFCLVLLAGFCAPLFPPRATRQFKWSSATTAAPAPLWTRLQSTVDSYEISVIQAQIQTRLQFWRAAQRPAEPD